MSWSNVPLEELMIKRLGVQLESNRAKELESLYITTRSRVFNEVLEGIPFCAPGLTDHGPTHVQDVMGKIFSLIGSPEDSLSGVELYLLCTCAIFHDSGNVFGREGHERNIARVYAAVRKGDTIAHSNERICVLGIARAHGGKTPDGNRDTIDALPEEQYLEGVSIRVKQLAAILRFADELAEGPQRTYDYVREVIGFPETNAIHHYYAKTVSITIDRSKGRIALTYNIDLSPETGIQLSEHVDLEKLVTYILTRISKLEIERQYNKFFSPMLQDFRYTSVEINFWHGHEHIWPEFPPLLLSDKRVPGEHLKPLDAINSAYEVASICATVSKLIGTRQS